MRFARADDEKLPKRVLPHGTDELVYSLVQKRANTVGLHNVMGYGARLANFVLSDRPETAVPKGHPAARLQMT